MPLLPVLGVSCGWDFGLQTQALKSLRRLASLAGLPPFEYALHSLGVGGTAALSAGEVLGHSCSGRVVGHQGSTRDMFAVTARRMRSRSRQSWEKPPLTEDEHYTV